MSILIFKPKGIPFNLEIAKKGELLEKKPLALNFSYAKDGALHTRKTEKYDKSVWDTIAELKDYATLIHINESDKELIKKEKINWSPVYVTKEIVLAGAGPVLALGESQKTKSDVKVFASHALTNASKRHPNFLFSEAGNWIINQILTPRAAMVALGANGQHTIFNERHGFEFEGTWIFDDLIANAKSSRRHTDFSQEEWQRHYENYGCP